jgi:hypothetical protein
MSTNSLSATGRPGILNESAERRGMLRNLAMGKDGRDACRVTTTLSRRQRDELERLSKQTGVKVAWLVRHATQRLLDEANRGTLPLEFGLEEAR